MIDGLIEARCSLFTNRGLRWTTTTTPSWKAPPTPRCSPGIGNVATDQSGASKQPHSRSESETMKTITALTLILTELSAAFTKFKFRGDSLEITDSALKLFLRELPDPLISTTLRDDIQKVLVDKSASAEEAGASIRKSVEERKKKGSAEEKYGLAVLARLMRHLRYVATFHKKNRVGISRTKYVCQGAETRLICDYAYNRMQSLGNWRNIRKACSLPVSFLVIRILVAWLSCTYVHIKSLA